MKRNLISLILLFPAVISFSQTALKGMVTDHKGQPIIGANVTIKNSYDGATTDLNGSFSFTTSEKDSQILEISYVGFETLDQLVFLNGTSLDIKSVLQPVVNELNMVVVSAGAFEASDVKRVTILRPLDIVTTAGAGGDTYGALQTLPGTQHVGGETGLFVRGGDASETKTFIDGIAVADPFFTEVPDIPQRGRFSPFLFKGTMFSTGGYSAEYGGAMSSALILESQDLPDRTTTNISLMSVGVGIGHSHLFKNNKTSLGIFASYVNLTPYYVIVPQTYDYGTPPESASGSIIFRQKTSKTGLLKMFANFSPTKVEVSYPYSIDSTSDDFTYHVKNRNFLANASYKEQLGKHWKIFAASAFSTNDDEILLNKVDTVNALNSLAQFKTTISRTIGPLSSIRFGTEVQYNHYEDGFNQYSSKIDDEYAAIYAEGDAYLTNKLVARIGLRLENSTVLKTGNLAPRASLAYKTGEFSQVSFACGQFYQEPDHFYFYATDPLTFERADHYILNYQVVSNKRTFRIEGYYKNYADLVKIIPDTTNNGNGYAKGFDVFWRDKKTIKYADYWISYSYLDTKRNYLYFPEQAVPSFAAKHTLSVVYKQTFPKINVTVGATYVFATGRFYINPYNPIVPGDKLPDYNNLSLSASYLMQLFQNFTVLAVGVQNVLGIDNTVGYRYFSDSESVEVKQPALRSYFIGLFMSIGEDSDE